MLTAPISVVKRSIRKAIKSVRSQTLNVAEIIIVDNNCKDQTGQIARELGAIVIGQKKQ